MSLPVEGHNENAENGIDIKQFLTKHKLLNILDIFKSRDVTIEELLEFDKEDLESFSKRDLELDTLQKTRFIKAIQTLKKSSSISISSIHPTNRPKQLTISTGEQKAISKLHATFDSVNKLINDLNMSSFKELELTSNQTNIVIETAIDNLIKQIISKKNELLNDIDRISQSKQKILENQLLSLQKHLPQVKNAQNQYHLYINDTLNYSDVTKRKKLILEMTDTILNDPGTVSSFILTKPSMQFIGNKYEQKLNELFQQNIFYVNDCDTPKVMQIVKATKISFHQIQIKFKLNEFDANKNIANKVEEIGVEWTKICKAIQKKKRKKKKKKKKRKNKYNDESDSSDSTDSTSQSESESESNSDSDSDESNSSSSDEKQHEYKMDDKKEYEWIQNDEIIKYKYKSSNKTGTGKYIIDELRDGYVYAIRIRARNESGWGIYSKVILIETKKKYSDYFYLFSTGHYITTNKGKILQSLNGDCNGQLVYGKLAIDSGIYKWYIKKITGIGCYHSAGIKSFRNKSAVYSNRRIQNGEGQTYYYDGLNSGWTNGATLKIKLDCNQWKVSFYMDYGNFNNMKRGRGRGRGRGGWRGKRSYRRKSKSKKMYNYNYGASKSNGKFTLIKSENVQKKQKYYFAMELCNANGNHFEMINEKRIKT